MTRNRIYTTRIYTNALGGALVLSVASVAANAADPGRRIENPSNSGIPGEEVRVVRWAPDVRCGSPRAGRSGSPLKNWGVA